MSKDTSVRLSKEFVYKLRKERLKRKDTMEDILTRMYLHWMRSKKKQEDE